MKDEIGKNPTLLQRIRLGAKPDKKGNMCDALDHMIQLIMLGWDFSDAAWHVSNVYGVDQAELEWAYGEHP